MKLKIFKFHKKKFKEFKLNQYQFKQCKTLKNIVL